jgi:hypothetical protein
MSSGDKHIDIDGLSLAYGGAAAETNRNIPAIRVASDAKLAHVHVEDAPFASVHNGANLSVRESTNTTRGHAMFENAGDVTVERFTSEPPSRTFAG